MDKLSVEMIMQMYSCSQAQADEIFAIETGEVDGDVEAIVLPEDGIRRQEETKGVTRPLR